MKTKAMMICILLLTTFNLFSQEKFEVEIKGTGQPILLFPGFTNTGEVWNDLAEELSTNYELHIFTFAGFGKVGPISFPWFPKIKDAVSEYVKENRLKKPIIIGHSLGGTLGLWLASEHLDVYSKVIAVDALPAFGALMMPDFKSENFTYDTSYNKQVLSMNDEEFSKMANQMAASMSLKEEKHAQLAEWIMMADRETYVYGYTDLLKLDLREEISKITIPVSLLVATHPYGKEMAEQTYTQQFKNLKKYDIHYAENSAHYIMFDQPEWFLSQIKSELKLK